MCIRDSFSPDEVNLRKGTKVRITGGDFEGYEGVFVKVKGARDRRVVISLQAVSYTHLDVYKRQRLRIATTSCAAESAGCRQWLEPVR